MSAAVPPHSVDAEKAVLGAILNEPPNFISVSNILRQEHFYLEKHQVIYAVIAELDRDGRAADIITVAELAGYRGKISVAYLSELVDSCPVTLHIDDYAHIVKQCYVRRKIIKSCQDVIKKALHYDGHDDEFLEQIEKELLQATAVQEQSGLIPASDVVTAVMEELESRIGLGDKLTGVPTGFKDLDAVTGGWQASDLIILAARPGMGKTALALNWAVAAARKGFPTVVFSLEMSKNQLIMRLLASEAKIDAAKMRRGNLNSNEQDLLMQGMRQLHDLPAQLSIDDTPAITMMELRSRCRRFQREHGLGLIVIDYLQLVGRNVESRYENREREISEISRSLKALAKELSVPVISLAQLNRGPDARPDKRPRMSDLRESGSMEQDADLVLFIYRDEYYHKSSEAAGKAEVIIGKNRHGPMETIALAFLANYVSFHTLDTTGFNQ